MTIIKMSLPYWVSGSYFVNIKYSTGSTPTSFGQGRLEASTEECVLILAKTLAERFNYDYATKG